MFYKSKKNRLSDSEIKFDEVVPDNMGRIAVERPIGTRPFVFIIITFLFFVAVGVLRIGYLSILLNGVYKNRAEANVNKIVIEPAERGIIVDRYGKPMVQNKPSLTAVIKISELVKNNEFDKLSAAVSEIGISNDDFSALFSNKDLEKIDTIILKKDISNQDAIFLNGLNLKSIIVQNDTKRFFEPEFAHIVGYTGLPSKTDVEHKKLNYVDVVGKTNLEALYDDTLRGTDGQTIIYRNVKGDNLGERSFSNPKIGNELKTTIDADLQRVFYDYLNKALHGEGAVGLAIDPRNGEIISLVSLPSFGSQEMASALTDGKKPLFNRAISGLYNPASTIKTIVGTAAINEDVIKPTEMVFSKGYLDIPNKYNPDSPTRFVDWRANGWVDIHSALAKSSNIYFYAVGGGLQYNKDLFMGASSMLKGLGVTKLREYFSIFGLDKKTGVELTGENSGHIPSPEEKKVRTGTDWTIGDTYNISIGQGDLAVTPLELLRGIISIVNGGYLYNLTLIANKAPLIAADNSRLSKAMAEVRQGMSDAVTKDYGSANMLNALPIKVIGKTGSAQVFSKKKTNAFTVACGPYPYTNNDKPICVLVLVENAKTGGLNAVPVVYNVFKWYAVNRL